MSEFIVSARKYRPETFQSVVGQSAITSTLKNAIANNHLGHAYLFCGPRGVGKTTCARIFAKTINCQNLGENTEPCNKCESCLSFNESRSYSIHELDAASNNTVDDIRSLNEKVRIPPQVGKYSVYIIDEVHMLSAQAFNAFLKTLEEPPAHAVFILATTEKHKIIPTILSRCQIFDFNRIKVPDAVSYLEYIAGEEGISYEKEALHIISQKADGAMRDALSIFDQVVSFSGGKISYQSVIDNLNILDFEYYFKLVQCFIEANVSESLLIFDEILDKGFDAHNFINGLAVHLRELLVSLDPKTIDLLEVSDNQKERYLEQSKLLKARQIFAYLEICSQIDLQYKASRNQRLLIEMGLVKMSNYLAEKKNSESLSEEVKPEKDRPEKSVRDENRVKKQNPDSEEKAVTCENMKSDNQGSEKQESSESKSEVSQGIRKNLVRSHGISIKDALNPDKTRDTYQEDEKNNEVENPEADEGQINDFSQEDLQKSWLNYAEKIREDKPRIYISLTNRTPVLKDGYKVEVQFDNESQIETFGQYVKPYMQNHLARELANHEIQIESKIRKDEKKGRKLYTMEDKFNYLSKKNPDLIKLKQQFNLDFD